MTRGPRSQVGLAVLVISIVVASGILIVALAAIHPPRMGWGSYEYTEAACIQQTSDGGYIILGNRGFLYVRWWGSPKYTLIRFDLLAENGSIFVIKTDSSGYIEWRRTYGGCATCWATTIHQTVDGGYIIAAILNGTDLWLIKTDSNGNAQWNRAYVGRGGDWSISAVEESNGGYTIAGVTSYYYANTSDVWVMRVDLQGNLEWNKTSTIRLWLHATSLQETSDEGFLITGRTPVDGNMFSFLLRMNRNGTLLGNVTYPSTSLDELVFAFEALDGGYVIAGRIATQSWSNSDFWLVKSDSIGSVLWSKTYHGGQRAWLESAKKTTDGGYLLAGDRVADNGSIDFWLVKTDQGGIAEWNRTYGASGYMTSGVVCQTSDGGYAIAGSGSFGKHQVWLVRVDADGSVEWDKMLEFLV